VQKAEEIQREGKGRREGTARHEHFSCSLLNRILECEGTWAAEMVKDVITEAPGPVSPIPEDLDWFEEAVAMIGTEKEAREAITVKSPIRDWFYEVVESDDESGNVGASSEDVLVDVFGRDAFEGTNPGLVVATSIDNVQAIAYGQIYSVPA